MNEKENESETQSTRVQESSKKDGRERDERDGPPLNVMKERDLSPAANPPNAFIPQSAPCPMRPPQQARD